MANRRFLGVAAVSVALVVAFFSLSYQSTPTNGFRGTVIDADSGRPIPDAVVAVVWCRRIRVGLTMDDTQRFFAAIEAVADGSGWFRTVAFNRIAFAPLSEVEPPEIGVVALGYWPTNAHYYPSLADDLANGRPVRLQPTPVDRHPDCQTTGPCRTGDFLFSKCDPPTGTLPNLERVLALEVAGLTGGK